MISSLELHKIIENAFLPLYCQCTLSPDGSLTVRIGDPDSGRVDLLVTGIASDSLNSARAISERVAELRDDLGHAQLSGDGAAPGNRP